MTDVYYTGQNGVYNYGGKDYKYGDLLPSDIPQDTVEAFVAKGKMSYTQPSVAVAAPAVGEVELLRARVTTLTEHYAASQQQVSELERLQAITDQTLTEALSEGHKLTVRITELEQQLTEAGETIATANQTIADLTNQLTAAPPKGGKK